MLASTLIRVEHRDGAEAEQEHQRETGRLQKHRVDHGGHHRAVLVDAVDRVSNPRIGVEAQGQCL